VSIIGNEIEGGIRINQNDSLVFQSGCLQSSQVQNNLDQELQQSASQIARAINSDFLSLNKANASNVANLTSQLATFVKNTAIQNCANTVFSQQAVQVNAEVVLGGIVINQTAYLNGVGQCIANQAANTKITDAFEQSINQSATAKTESFLAPFLTAFLVILGLIALFLFLPSFFRGRETAPPQQPQAGGEIGQIAAETGASPSQILQAFGTQSGGEAAGAAGEAAGAAGNLENIAGEAAEIAA
jgi:hypothetical protein